MANTKNILITGASGLIGTRLTAMLQQRGHQVSYLGRGKKDGPVRSFTWSIDQRHIEANAFDGIDTIVHLAGAGVADKSWTAKRKEEIMNSRTHSTRLLYDELKKGGHQVTSFIGASGIAYYGVEESQKPHTEDELPASDFLAVVTQKWEEEEDRIGELMRVCKIRTGIVLSNNGGALPKLSLPVKLLVGAPLGTGDQMMNWIHIDDHCALYVRAIEDASMQGAYNGVSPAPVTNREFTKAIARTIRRPLWLPAIPAFVMKLLLADMAYIVLKGGAVSSAKVEREGFKFRFTELDKALDDLLR
jgi:uncharacterized protein